MSKYQEQSLFENQNTAFAPSLPRNAIDERNHAAVDVAVTQIVDYFRTESPRIYEEVKKVYDFKKSHNPTMPKFDDWYRDVWATQMFQEANRFCGGYTLDTVRRIVTIEYKGTPLLRNIKDTHPTVEVGAEVEEGTVYVRVDVPVLLNEMSNVAMKIASQLKDAGYKDVEVVEDFDEEVIPVQGYRKFVPPREK